MKTQVLNSENQEKRKTIFANPTNKRRIVYLKDESVSESPLLCRIECPGYCACASK